MSQPTIATTQKQRPDYNSAEEYYESRGIRFPAEADLNPDSVVLSAEELSIIKAESAIQAFHNRRRAQEMVDVLFDGEKATDGMIVFARHASECVRTATDRELTKQLLHFMGPIAYTPGITPELLDAVHTMMVEAYFYGRERMIQDAYEMGAAVKV